MIKGNDHNVQEQTEVILQQLKPYSNWYCFFISS